MLTHQIRDPYQNNLSIPKIMKWQKHPWDKSIKVFLFQGQNSNFIVHMKMTNIIL
jgi:hypothetical protein